MPFDRITLINVQPPRNADINQELQWLGATLGLFGQRDKDSSCFRVFITIINSSSQPLTSDEIAQRCGLTRGTVVHHLNKLRDAGLVAPATQGYSLAATSIQESLQAMEEEIQQTLALMRAVAKDIDKKLQ
ncbi:MAG: ArsR/SmtB family transcription factor [Candidatus Woesearchaeota archaeon]